MLWNLTCHTPDCHNEDFTVQFPDPAELVICGGCHQEITDKTPIETKES
jgi:hypothetical protein